MFSICIITPILLKLKKRFLNKYTQVCFYIYFYIYTSVKT